MVCGIFPLKSECQVTCPNVRSDRQSKVRNKVKTKEDADNNCPLTYQMCNCSDWILLEHIYGTYACKLCFVQYACLYSIRMHARLCMCVHCSHRQTHGSLRSGEYYREVDHRGTRLVAKRQAPLINPLHTDAFPLCLSVSLTLSITVFSLFSTVPFCFVSIPYFVWLCLHSWEKGVFTCEIFKNHKSII